MRNRNPQTRAVALGSLMMMGLTLCGGCAPLDSATFVTFVSDFLRGITAALLL